MDPRLDHQGRALLGAVVAAGAMMVAVGVLVGLAGVVAALAVMGVAIGYVNIVAISWIQGLKAIGRSVSRIRRRAEMNTSWVMSSARP